MQRATINLADEYNCTGCMACVDVCNNHAITRYMANDGHFYVKIDNNLCVSCKKCELLCNKIHSGYGVNDNTKSSPFAACAANEVYRKNGTSGGVFAALAANVIKQGGIVVSSTFDGISAKHILISKIEEIPALQGSRYVQSNTLGIYLQIGECLSNKKVLFCGLGCQVAAVLAYFDKHPHKDNLMTVDMVCAGVPSSLLITKYIATHPNFERIISYRKKRKYVFEGIVDGKRESLNGKPLPLAGFRLGFTNRYSCYNCKFAKIHRDSDLTIGDLWGNDLLSKEEYDKGISLVLVHNDRGHEMLSSSAILYQSIAWEDCLPYNGRIYNGKRMISILRKKLPVFSYKWDAEKFNKIYSFDLKLSDGFWWFYKLYWIIQKRIEKFNKKHKINGKNTF